MIRFVVPAVGVAAALLVLGSAEVSAQGLPESGFTVGEPFPTTALPALDDGRPMSVADFRGKRLILHIFASW